MFSKRILWWTNHFEPIWKWTVIDICMFPWNIFPMCLQMFWVELQLKYEKSIARTLIVWQTNCFPVIIALCTVGTWQNVKIEITNENELRLNIESNEQMAKVSKIRRSKWIYLNIFVFFYWRLNNFSIGDFGVCLFVCVTQNRSRKTNDDIKKTNVLHSI